MANARHPALAQNLRSIQLKFPSKWWLIVADGEITEEIKRFVNLHINSVEQLEVLLLLKESSDKPWSAASVSRALYIQPESAQTRLDSLRSKGIITTAANSEKEYCYNQGNSNDAVVAGLAQAYKIRRVAITNLIFEKPVDNVRVFSDAFRIRRDD